MGPFSGSGVGLVSRTTDSGWTRHVAPNIAKLGIFMVEKMAVWVQSECQGSASTFILVSQDQIKASAVRALPADRPRKTRSYLHDSLEPWWWRRNRTDDPPKLESLTRMSNARGGLAYAPVAQFRIWNRDLVQTPPHLDGRHNCLRRLGLTTLLDRLADGDSTA